MRRSLIAVAALLAMVSPTLANELSDAKAFIEAAGLSDKADLLLWCGAAFTIASAASANDADKKTADDLANLLFTKAATLMTAEGVKNEDLGTFGNDYAVVAKAQIVDHAEDPEHTQEDCTAAASAE